MEEEAQLRYKRTKMCVLYSQEQFDDCGNAYGRPIGEKIPDDIILFESSAWRQA